jgi:ABC-type Fe3+/spermidine/putrescine transport system ATPase subunit
LFGKYTLLSTGTFNALFPAAAVKTRRKHILIRPEQLKIVAKSKKALKARVTAVNFMGGFYELEVFTSGIHIAIRTDTLPEATEVYLTINPAGAWPID